MAFFYRINNDFVEIKGNALHAFVILHDGAEESEDLKGEIRKLVSDTIGPIAKPDVVQFVKGKQDVFACSTSKRK